MQALDALLNRVSVPRLLEPAPTQEQRDVLFAAAMRAPDHGQLRPWRFLTVEGAAREQMGTLLVEAARLQDPDAPQAVLDKAQNGPLRAPLVVVVIAACRNTSRCRNPSNCWRRLVPPMASCWRPMPRGLARCGAPATCPTRPMWPRAWD